MTTIKTIVLDLGNTNHMIPNGSFGPVKTFTLFQSNCRVDKTVIPDIIDRDDGILKVDGYRVLGHTVRERS